MISPRSCAAAQLFACESRSVDLETLLGIDPADPRDRLADYIVTADEDLMRELVARRKELGLRQEDVAERMGIDKSNVSRIERGDRDLLQSTLRRYLMAIDSVVVHEVRAFEDIDCARKAAHYYSSDAHAYAQRTKPMPQRTVQSAHIYV